MIPRSSVELDAVVPDHHVGHVRDDALAAADDEAALDEAGGQLDANEMSMPCVAAPGSERISQSRIVDLAPAGVDPVELRRLDDDAVELDALGVATSIPYSPPRTVTFADRDVVRRDQDAAADDRALLADDGLGVVEDERPLVHAGREPDRRRLDRPRDARARRASATGAAAERPTPARPSSPPSSGQVRRSSGSTACASSCASSQAPAKKRSAGRSGALSSSSRAAASVSPSSSRPSGTATQPGW